ncbi:TPA: pheST operon leader peptide PheM [Yersinia enterocolitica]|nr:pheST operon leader peptide PheM [Yersinia intermedia]MCB5320791.1 pheST operon leader peptide PheM [Yersinia intermedia]MCB5327122.1 pheST operon leader peptide PheM [Yersinia intermedia]
MHAVTFRFFFYFSA